MEKRVATDPSENNPITTTTYSDSPRREPPDVSVIIVNFETSEYTRRCLASLRQQGLPVQTIVVDNPSPKNDAENLAALDDILLVRNSENIGYGQACNRGFSYATADIVCILNPDTVVPSGMLRAWLEKMKMECAKGVKVGILAPSLLNENGSRQRSTYGFPNFFNYWLHHSLLAGILKTMRKKFRIPTFRLFPWGNGIKEVPWVMGSAMMIPRSAWEAVGGFSNLFFLYAEDMDLCYRLRACGYSILFDPSLEIIHTQGNPPAEKRDLAIRRLFDSLEIFLRAHYNRWQRIAVRSAVVLDMALRILLFSAVRLWKPHSTLTQKRLEGYHHILRSYVRNFRR